jgi:hypothetical protein
VGLSSFVMSRREYGGTVNFTGADVDVAPVVGNGSFSERAVDVSGGGRMGRGLPFCGHFNSIGWVNFGEEKARYPGTYRGGESNVVDAFMEVAI